MAHFQGTSPRISRKTSLALRTVTACWRDDLREFDATHSRQPFDPALPLYALPDRLLAKIQQFAPNWLDDDETVFERDLARLCLRHNAVGVFHGAPVQYPLLIRLQSPDLSEDLFKNLGWDRFMTLHEARRSIRTCIERIDPLHERSVAYVGWLLTSSEFLSERDRLRARWEYAIRELGNIPAYPVQAAESVSRSRRPRNGRDVLPDFIADFNNFYERWQLQRLATWDLPEPCGANLTGEDLPCSRQSVSRFTLDVPCTLRLPANFPLRSILEEFQRRNIPDHLRPWLEAQDQQHSDGLRHGRFANMFLLAFYRDTVLASRYQDRFRGLVENIDEAMGDFISLGVDSVKKLRLKVAELRSRHA